VGEEKTPKIQNALVPQKSLPETDGEGPPLRKKSSKLFKFPAGRKSSGAARKGASFTHELRAPGKTKRKKEKKKPELKVQRERSARKKKKKKKDVFRP